MTMITQEPSRSGVLPAADLGEEEVRSKVWGLLGALYPRQDLVDRRKDHRYPYPYLIQLTPIADDGSTPQGESVAVVGKYVSERGLGFYHPHPITYRRVIVSLEAASGESISFQTDLTWCRFTKQGWYESGGRFLEVVASSNVVD